MEENLLSVDAIDDDEKLQRKVLLSSTEMGSREPPDMWTKDYIGFYSSYGAIGLVYGMGPTIIPFCASLATFLSASHPSLSVG